MIQTLLTVASFRRWRERSLRLQSELLANSAIEDRQANYPPPCEPVLEEFSDYISELFMQEFVYPSLHGGLQPERSGAPFTWNSRTMNRLWVFITTKARELEIPLHYVLPLLPYLNGVQTFRMLDSTTSYSLIRHISIGGFYRFTSTLPYLSRINNVALNGINPNWATRPEGNPPVMSSQIPGYFCAPTDYMNQTLFVSENMLVHGNAHFPTPVVCKVIPDLRTATEFPITVPTGSYERSRNNEAAVPALQAASVHFWGPGYFRLSTQEEIDEFFRPFLNVTAAWIGFGGRSVENVFEQLGYNRAFYSAAPSQPVHSPQVEQPIGAAIRTNAEVPQAVPRQTIRQMSAELLGTAASRRQTARAARAASQAATPADPQSIPAFIPPSDNSPFIIRNDQMNAYTMATSWIGQATDLTADDLVYTPPASAQPPQPQQ